MRIDERPGIGLAQKPGTTRLRENRLRGGSDEAGMRVPVGENQRLRDEVEVGEPPRASFRSTGLRRPSPVR